VLPIVHFLNHLAFSTIKRNKFGDKKYSWVSSILSYDRTNSLYKSVIRCIRYNFKYNGNDALTIANTGEATFAKCLGNISSTRTNPVLEAISNGASANRTRLAVATTAGAYTNGSNW
jgi:hypothetical protein